MKLVAVDVLNYRGAGTPRRLLDGKIRIRLGESGGAGYRVKVRIHTDEELMIARSVIHVSVLVRGRRDEL